MIDFDKARSFVLVHNSFTSSKRWIINLKKIVVFAPPTEGITLGTG